MILDSSQPCALPLKSHRATLVPAPGVGAIANLEAFLPECGRIVRAMRPRGDIDSVAGWGFKPTAAYARRLARAHGWPYLALEDGFLRSVGLGESGAPPLSLVVDDIGVYYDARGPSRLEAILQDGTWADGQILERAARLMDRLRTTGLTKTNSAPPLPDCLLAGARRRVLVVDQTAGDESIIGGLADSFTFTRMLDCARRDCGGAEIVVRQHPAVSAGLKRGCLPKAALSGVTVLDQNCRVSDVLARVDEVYTVSSLTGLEALIRGLPVRCFGLPFYAGWGLTRDELSSPRRTRRHTLTSLVAGCYMMFPRYIDPVTGEPISPENAIERLNFLRACADANAGFTACVGYAPWKHGAARTLLYSPRGKTKFFANPPAAVAAAKSRTGRIVFWAGRETARLSAQLEGQGPPLIRMEDGFIRSQGLGSDFHRAASVVLDDLGIYYDATRPSRLEVLLQTYAFSQDLITRASALRRRLAVAGVSKYNLWRPQAADLKWPGNGFKLLVVGQVEDDKSILRGCEQVRTNLGLLRAARERHPEASIVYKPHPDVESGNRIGAVDPKSILQYADAIATDLDIESCIAAADGLATMTSLAGFEALLRGKPVWTFGRPFFAGWGLTLDSLELPRRTRKLELDQLVAGALILYPRYVHPTSGIPCEVEDLINYLEIRRHTSPGKGGRRPRYWRAIWESLRSKARGHY